MPAYARNRKSMLTHHARFILCIATAMSTMLLSSVAPAQQYPHKPIRFIVPFPPGGATDVISRVVGQKLHDALGQQIIIDSRGGGATVVGTELAARAAPDGHTIFLGTFGFATTPALHRNLPYDVVRDFAPVSQIAQGMLVLAVHPSLPVKSVGELIAMAKAKGDRINFGTSGGGTSTSLAGILLQSMTGIQMTEVPYKGSGPGLTGLLAGEVNIAFFSSVAALPFAKAGKLRILGVTSAKRTSLLPDVPTIAESGTPGYELSQWYGIILPCRAPPQIVSRLHNEFVRIMHRDDVREVFAAQGLDATATSPAEFAAFIASEVKKWSRVLKEKDTRRD